MKIVRFLLSISLLAPVFSFAPVLAEGSTSGTSGSGTGSPTSVTTNVSPGTGQPTSTSGSGDRIMSIGDPSTEPTAMKKRLDDLKAGLKINLTETTKKAIVQKCKPAQTVVQGAEKSDLANGTHRDEIYKKIIDSLKTLIDRLKANNVDTTALAAAETMLETKVSAFNTDMTTYRQAMSDLKSLDCATDPTAFQAALQTARTDREKVRMDAADIRTYITTTLKPALQAIRDKVKGTSDNATPQSTSTTNTTDKTKQPTTTGGNQ